jgi:hypothetical protein
MSQKPIRIIVDVEYHSRLLSYSNLVTRVLQKSEELTDHGFICVWDKKYYLDLDDIPKKGLGTHGYIDLGERISTVVRKECTQFSIDIFPESKKAKISGQIKDFRHYNLLEQELEEFSKITGVKMYLNMTSEPYIVK